MSISPGRMVKPEASISRLPAGTPRATATMYSPSIAISASKIPGGVAMLPPRITSSDIADEPYANLDSRFDIGGDHRFIRMVADAARASEEQHRGRDMRREDHRVMAGAARHAMHGIAGGLHGTGQRFPQARIEGNRGLIETMLA